MKKKIKLSNIIKQDGTFTVFPIVNWSKKKRREDTMRHNIFLLLLFYFALSCMLAFGQKGVSNEAVSSKKEMHDADLKHSIGSSLYLLGNLRYKEPVYDLHLNYGYRLTKKDVLIVEGMT